MSANLGKISITVGGDHVISSAYERLTVVRSSSYVWYLSVWDVPENIELSNLGYWVVFFDPAMNTQQIADNAQAIVLMLQSIDDINTKIGVSAVNIVNNIVKRDGAGDIFVRLLRTEHINTGSTFNYFLTQNELGVGVDNYAKPTPITAVQGAVKGATPNWLTITPEGNWTGSIKYRKWDSGLIELMINVSFTLSLTGYAACGILPLLFRPDIDLYFPVFYTLDSGCRRAYVATNGGIYIERGGAQNYGATLTFMT